MPIVVIGAGHGRTGTTSLRLALTKLLGGPCYHMDCITVEGKIDHTQVWMAMGEAKARGDTAECAALGKKLLDDAGQVAAIDYPASFFYEELMQAYPDAKVVLTMRESDKWYDSVVDSLWGIRCAQAGTWMIKIVPPVIKLNKFVDALIWFGPHSMFKGKFTDKKAAIAIYEAWNEEVKRVVPKDRLLVWDVKEGYGPLCKFLNLPTPAEPFPHINEKSRFENLIKIMGRVDKIGKFIVAPALLFGAAYAVKRLLR